MHFFRAVSQYSDEKPADPIQLRIYTGADAEFELYEDENDSYNYEKGIDRVFQQDRNHRKDGAIHRRGDENGRLSG